MATIKRKGKVSLHSIEAKEAARILLRKKADEMQSEVSTPQVVKDLTPEISFLREKGCSAEDILELLKNAGIDITLPTLCKYLTDKQKRGCKSKQNKINKEHVIMSSENKSFADTIGIPGVIGRKPRREQI